MSDDKHSNIVRLDPIQGILEIIERASITGTNKFGLLLVLFDIAPQRIENNRPITKHELTERYMDIHWEHARPYGDIELRQSAVKKKRNDGTLATDTTVMQQIYLLREELELRGYGSLRNKFLDVVKSQVAGEDWWDQSWNSALADIQKDLWRNPINRLQNLPGDPTPFLYEITGQEVRFIEGVAEAITKFAGVLRPLVEFRFSELVAKINRDSLGNTAEHQIHEHLFGGDRNMPSDAMRDDLIEIQNNRCIYSGSLLDPSSKSLDHVIPWSRVRLSHIENFLVTTKKANSSKSDTLLAPDLLERWLEHLEHCSSEINQVAKKYGWPSDMNLIYDTSYNIYKVLDPRTGVWDGEKGVTPIGSQGIERVKQKLTDTTKRGI
ncbi:MAG: HNH endonuclease signature motif containing protein [bacterium]|nr:HNH endonuclease signature motif containing protein [bacterium]